MPETSPGNWGAVRTTSHRNDDDLLSAGLGLAGLRLPAPALADGLEPADRLRRLAIHANWKGLADLTATGGFGADDELPRVPGREFRAFARLPERAQPFRVLLQLPDAFDPEQPCLVVAPVSGSRGIYGAVPVAGPWALARGCAVVYTDKGAGTDLFDHASDTGVTLDGTLAERGAAELGFEPAPIEAPRVSLPHAHSGDHPEADWDEHTRVATRFALAMLQQAFPARDNLDAEGVRIVLAAISNGGNAALRALEADRDGLFDAAVVAAPNITPPGARPLYDYASQAALLQPCLLADAETLAQLPFANPMLLPAATARCRSAHAAGLIEAPEAAAARARLEADGFDAGALEQAAVNAALDVWRSVVALYAPAYLRRPVDAMPCGYSVAVLDEQGQPTAPDADQRELWWPLSSGVVPGHGINWIDTAAERSPGDTSFAGLVCLRELWTGESPEAETLRAAVEQTRASARLPDVPVLVIHGAQDGLIPAAFSSRPYVEQARANGHRKLAYWEIDGAQHFDVLVPFPGMNTRYRPLLPVLWDGLDRIEAVLDGRADAIEDRVIRAIAD
ncbi:MAG: 3-hydroxybutyrate oligomer hydrolase family protein [Wenzhouxiangellaceae bacterium]|nr:3-hydroxybutyrate oligomer hydrolase family protein [Wenzhouxiangellaceae bacterium]